MNIITKKTTMSSFFQHLQCDWQLCHRKKKNSVLGFKTKLAIEVDNNYVIYLPFFYF